MNTLLDCLVAKMIIFYFYIMANTVWNLYLFTGMVMVLQNI